MDDPSQHRALLLCGRGKRTSYKLPCVIPTDNLLHSGEGKLELIGPWNEQSEPETYVLSHHSLCLAANPARWPWPGKATMHVSLCLGKVSGGSWLLHQAHRDRHRTLTEQHTSLYISTALKSFLGKTEKVIVVFPVRKERSSPSLRCWRILAGKEPVVICTILLVDTQVQMLSWKLWLHNSINFVWVLRLFLGAFRNLQEVPFLFIYV